MPGTNAGTGQPIALKCSQCKKGCGGPRIGNLMRTGRQRPYKPRAALGRITRIAHECRCLDCGHTGWYAHGHARRLPLIRINTTPPTKQPKR